MAEYDIFLSYRRVGSVEFVEELYSRLVSRGYRVFQDLEELNEGKYEEKLLMYVKECKDFILPLPAGALDRCNNPEDMVRKEIATALASGKNIIPIYLHGFEMPNILPPDIDAIRDYNAIITYGLSYDDIVREVLKWLHSQRILYTPPLTLRLLNWFMTNEHVYIWRIAFFPILAFALLSLFTIIFGPDFEDAPAVTVTIFYAGLFFSLFASTLIGCLLWVNRKITRHAVLRWVLNVLIWPIAYLPSKLFVDHILWTHNYELWLSRLGIAILFIPVIVTFASFICTVLVNFFAQLFSDFYTEITK